MVLVWDGRWWVRNVGGMAMAAAWVSVRLLLSGPSPFSFPYSSHWDFFGSLPKHAQFDSVSALGFTCTFRSSLGWFLHIHLVSTPIYLPSHLLLHNPLPSRCSQEGVLSPTNVLSCLVFPGIWTTIWKSWLFMFLLYHCSFIYVHVPLCGRDGWVSIVCLAYTVDTEYMNHTSISE